MRTGHNRIGTLVAAMIGAAAMLMTPAAHAQCNPQEIAQLLSDGYGSDAFGYSVSISGNTAVVGAPRNGWLGSVCFYEKVNGVWGNRLEFVAWDNGGAFGWSVCLSGDTAFVSDPDYWGAKGRVWIFERDNNGAWSKTAELMAIDAVDDLRFGESVSFSGDTAIVGASRDSSHGLYSGAAYIFNKINGAWIQQAKLTASDASANRGFGSSVAISGDTAFIGAAYPGQVYIFEYNSNTSTWIQTSTFVSPGQSYYSDAFGRSISVHGDTALVGAPGYIDQNNGNTGAAFIYERIGGAWAKTANLLADDRVYGQAMGYSVSLSPSGDRAIMGAPAMHASGNGRGSAYIFNKINGAWIQQARLIASDAPPQNSFGTAASISGDTAIVGWSAYNNDFGKAYLFDLNCSPTLHAPDPLPAGTDCAFTATNLTPNANAYLLYSVRGLGSVYFPLLNITIDLLGPKQVGPRMTTDASGQVEWMLHVPPLGSAVPIWFQVVQFQNKTNVVATQIVP